MAIQSARVRLRVRPPRLNHHATATKKGAAIAMRSARSVTASTPWR